MAHILITNDDGIHAEGLRALVAAVRDLGRVSVAAPHTERSATAQSITLRQPIYYEETAPDEWAVEGTPTDAVILALNKLLSEPPDLVISGINRGGNMGENVYYSGTVGAAMEATINHIPALAISVAHKGRDFDYRPAAAFAHRLAELVLQEGLPKGVLLNVNVPQPASGRVRFTRQSEKITRNILKEESDPGGRLGFWLYEQITTEGVEPDTDYAAVFSGAISVTPLELNRTHSASMNHLSRWVKRLEVPAP